MKWDQIKLGDAATFINGYPFKPTDWSENGREIIRIQNLTKSTDIKANRFDGKIAERYLVKKGNLLISWSGTLGVYEWDGEDAWLNQHIFKVVLDKKEINKKYFKYLIQSKISELERQVHGATMKHITKGKFDNIQIPLPPLPIQQQIADTLYKADSLRRKDQELLEKYDELAQAVFYEMFGDIKNRSKNWDWTSLESVLEDIVAGSSVGGEDKVLQNGELGVLKISAVTSGKFLKDEYKVPDQRLLPKNLIHPQKGDLLFSRANTRELVGATAIVESDCSNIFLPDKLWKLKPKPSVNSVYLKFILSEPSIKYELTKTATGTSGSMLNISMAKLRSLNIPLPYIDIQDSFAARIKMLNQIITNGQSIKKFSDGLFESLLTRIH